MKKHKQSLLSDKRSVTTYKIKKGFITQKMGDKITMFDGEESLLYTLNETASFVFEKLKQGLDKKEIVNLLVKRYSIKKDKAEEDTEELIGELKKKKIIS